MLFRSTLWKEERTAAFQAIEKDKDIRIKGFDIDPRAIAIAQANAEEAGVEDCIEFAVASVDALKATEPYGVIIGNPPYGERIGEREQIRGIYRSLSRFLTENPTWSLYMVTSDKEFEGSFLARPADRRRKLYNGRIEICYYQYYGEKPARLPKEKEERVDR